MNPQKRIREILQESRSVARRDDLGVVEDAVYVMRKLSDREKELVLSNLKVDNLSSSICHYLAVDMLRFRSPISVKQALANKLKRRISSQISNERDLTFTLKAIDNIMAQERKKSSGAQLNAIERMTSWIGNLITGE